MSSPDYCRVFLLGAGASAAYVNPQGIAMPLVSNFFEAGYKVNPSHRDVLYNLARLYILDNANTKALPLVRQLIAVDPSNPNRLFLTEAGAERHDPPDGGLPGAPPQPQHDQQDEPGRGRGDQ